MPGNIKPYLRIGLIGCGRIAQHVHLPVLTALDGVELAAVAEVDAGRREACRAVSPRARLFADYRDLLDEGDVEAVVICLPPALHAETAVACFERNLHVYVEKPLATTLEDGEKVVAAWRQAGTVGRIGFNCRFHPLVAELRAVLRRGIPGGVIGARTVFCAARRTLPEWKRDRAIGGGVLLDLVSHHFDLVRFVFDQEIVEIGALLRSFESEEDTVAIKLRLAAGPLVTTFASLAAVEEDCIEVYGSSGKLVFDRYRSSRLGFTPSRRDYRWMARVRAAAATLAALPRTARDILSPPRERSFAFALAAFGAAIQGRTHKGPDLEDGLRSLAAVIAAERAARSGETVALARVAPISRGDTPAMQATASLPADSRKAHT
ncbi:MAG: Gfo/Idh/MocA family protein [Candidatus Binatia bacterium]